MGYSYARKTLDSLQASKISSAEVIAKLHDRIPFLKLQPYEPLGHYIFLPKASGDMFRTNVVDHICKKLEGNRDKGKDFEAFLRGLPAVSLVCAKRGLTLSFFFWAVGLCFLLLFSVLFFFS